MNQKKCIYIFMHNTEEKKLNKTSLAQQKAQRKYLKSTKGKLAKSKASKIYRESEKGKIAQQKAMQKFLVKKKEGC
jgi:hypothetical protein